MKKLFLIQATTIFIFLAGCKKESQSFCIDATVMWGGDPAADGLGWYLLADSVHHIFYVPQNLPDSLKLDGQLVNVCLYKTEESFYCECKKSLKKYHITSIRRL